MTNELRLSFLIFVFWSWRLENVCSGRTVVRGWRNTAAFIFRVEQWYLPEYTVL